MRGRKKGIRPAKRPVPGVAIPPGAHLAEELEARGMTQSELARRMGRPVQPINEIVRGVKQITAETALQLEDVLGVDAAYWMRLEAQYRLTKAILARHRQRSRTLARRSAHVST